MVSLPTLSYCHLFRTHLYSSINSNLVVFLLTGYLSEPYHCQGEQQPEDNGGQQIESKGFELSGNCIYNEDANTIKHPRDKGFNDIILHIKFRFIDVKIDTFPCISKDLVLNGIKWFCQ